MVMGGSDLNQDHVYANQAFTHKLNEKHLVFDLSTTANRK